MTAANGKAVLQKEGNVYSCTFGGERGDTVPAAGARTAGADIRSEVAEINMLIREIAGANAGIADQSAVNSQLLLNAIAKLDSIAFQANLLAHGLAHGLAGDGLDLVAADVNSFVAEGSGVVRRLRALVSEHKIRIANLARALSEIGERVVALEAMTSARVGPVRPAAAVPLR